MYICRYAGSEKPNSGGNIFFEQFATATNLLKVKGNIYVTTYAMSFLLTQFD